MKNDLNSSAATDIHKFILFVSGMSSKSGFAIENIRKICDHYLPGGYELQIVDINTDSEKAVAYQVIAIPTLIKVGPPPVRTIIGDLSDTQKVLKILDINA